MQNLKITVFVINLLILIGYLSAELEQRKVVFLEKADFSNTTTTTSNYLFRGNQPKITVNGTTVFSYDLLKLYLQNTSLESGFKLPDDYYLIDIKYLYFMDDPEEKGDVILETNFFKANPSLGEARFEQIFGDDSDPNAEDADQREKKAVNLGLWQHDNLPARIPLLRELLFTQGKKPIVIYFHCECGCDRTGEVGASYAMKFLGKTYREAMEWDNKIAGRPIFTNNKRAVAWYCYYLSFVEAKDVQCNDFAA